MTQYDPTVVKAGIPTALGADTLRADLTGLGGATTAGLAAGDAVQVSTALAFVKAVNTAATAVVGVYDGTTGSVVRDGAVSASYAGAAPAAGDTLYLSSTAGQLTNVKPTMDVLHEVGVALAAGVGGVVKTLLTHKPVVVLPPSPPPYLWTSNTIGTGGLTQVLVSDGSYVNRVQTGVKFRFALYDGTYVWGISEGDNPPFIIVKLDPVTGAQVGYYAKDRTYNDGMLMAFDGTNIWYSVDNYPNVICVDSNFNYIRGVNAGAAWPPPNDVIYDGAGNIWALSPNYIVYKFRASDGAGLGSYDTGGAYRRSMWTDKTYVWLVRSVGGVSTTLIRIRITDLAVTLYPGFPGGGSQFGGFTDGVGNVYFITSTGGSNCALHKVRASDGVELSAWTLTVDAMPNCIRFNGTRIWGPGGGTGKIREWTFADPPVYVGDYPASGTQTPFDCAFTNIVLPWP